MSEALANELKHRGNEAFAAKRYEDALVLYDKAIEANPNDYVFYNNRAAANHALKHYDQAIEDARKSIALYDNAKAHTRIGAALWAQKKLSEAKAEFEVASAMDPNNTSIKDNIQQLNQLLNPRVDPAAVRAAAAGAYGAPTLQLLGGEVKVVENGVPGLIMDVAIIVLAGLFSVTTFIRPPVAAQCWSYLLYVSTAQQVLSMQKLGLLGFSMDSVKKWGENYCSCSAMVTLLALVGAVSPQLVMVLFIAMYCAIDLIDRRVELSRILGPAFNVVNPLIQKGVAQRTQILLLAATFEALLTLTIMFNGGAIFTLVYTQYGINRYAHDGYVRMAFSGMRMNLGRVTRASFMPAFVDRYAQKFCELLHTVAMQGAR